MALTRPRSNEFLSIPTLVNVYQFQYTNGRTLSGLGDFLSGCFYAMQYCKIIRNNNIALEIDFSNHPIGKYLLYHTQRRCDVNYNQIKLHTPFNREIPDPNVTQDSLKDDIARDFNQKKADAVETESTTQSSLPFVCPVGIYAFPIVQQFSPEGKEFMRCVLTPGPEMELLIGQRIASLGLKSGRYAVIHIRTGDEFLIHKEGINVQLYTNVMRELLPRLIKGRNYLLISDNNSLKHYVMNHPDIISRGIKMHGKIYKMVHLSGDVHQRTDNGNIGGYVEQEENEGIKNTLLDFFIMGRSRSILALHTYQHVTNFSKWCATIYDVPFESRKIDVGDNTKIR